MRSNFVEQAQAYARESLTSRKSADTRPRDSFFSMSMREWLKHPTKTSSQVTPMSGDRCSLGQWWQAALRAKRAGKSQTKGGG